GLRGHVAGGAPLLEDAALGDARARADPLVAGIDPPGDVAIGDDSLGQRAAGAEDDASYHVAASASSESCAFAAPRSHSLSWHASVSPTACVSWLSTKRLDALIAFLIAVASLRPWQIMTTPRTPSSNAPPVSE